MKVKKTKKNKDSFFQKIKIVYKEVNKPILIMAIVLMVIGIIMVYTASSYLAMSQDLPSYFYMLRQLAFAAFGLLLIGVLSAMKIDMFKNKKIMNFLLLVVVLLLLVVFIVGTARNGALGWISIGSLSLQPIEFAKPIVILAIANFIAHEENNIEMAGLFQTMKKNWPLPIGVFAIILITLAFPDMGGAALVGGIALLMLLGSGIPRKWFTRLLLFGLIAFLLLNIGLRLIDLSNIDNYQIQRLTSYINPFAYAQGEGLQLVNGYYALALGGLFGSGPGNSIQKTGYLPEPHNDFIMAVIGEEFGFIVVILILIIYFALMIYILLKSVQMKETFHQLILIGVASYFFMQIFINLGGVLGLIPITGVTLPFLSYGGSSVAATAIMIGLALSAIRNDERLDS